MASLFLRRFLPESCAKRWVHVDLCKNEATGTRQTTGSGPFVGCGVALGVRMLERAFVAWSEDAKKPAAGIPGAGIRGARRAR